MRLEGGMWMGLAGGCIYQMTLQSVKRVVLAKGRTVGPREAARGEQGARAAPQGTASRGLRREVEAGMKGGEGPDWFWRKRAQGFRED